MANSSTFSARLRSRCVLLTLLTLALWACSSDDAGEDASTDGSGQHIEDPEPGSGGMSASDGGTDGVAPEPGGDGKGSATAQPDSTAGASGSMATPDVGEGGASGGEPESEPPSAEFLRGRALVEQNECVTCHQENFAGFTVFPNITPDEATGIGTWTDEQIVAAIRDGVDADGKSMCPTMMRYSFADEQLSDIVAFLRGIPAVHHKLTSQCPGHGK